MKIAKKSKKIKFECKICNKDSFVYKNTYGFGKYCSRECFHKSRIEPMKGRKNINYKHGKTGSSEMFLRKNLKRVYGITLEQKREIYELQDGKCSICSKPIEFSGKLGSHLDHNHKSGKIRGLLCRACNNGLGNFKDNISFLENAIVYLKVWNQ